MNPGEIIVARLKGGAGIARLIAADPEKGQRVRIALGRNREAQLPADRIILATGVPSSGLEEVEEFRRRCEDLASSIELSEVWEVARDEGAITLDDLAELYWGPAHDAAQRVALLLHVDRTPLYFAAVDGSFSPQPTRTVQETLARSRREEENARDSEELMSHLAGGQMPLDPTPHQSDLVAHLRRYIVHGENYTRKSVARRLLEPAAGGTSDLQRFGFDLLVNAGVLSADEHLELERADIPVVFPADALEEAGAIDLSELMAEPERRDLTHLPTFTIDDADTEDRDDALSLEVEESGDEGATAICRVGIHIADAASLVVRDGPVDREADRRMASLYTPDRKVPMLPEAISGGVGSLAPGERRAALSVLAQVDPSGEVMDWEVVPSAIQSDAALSYEEVDLALAEADRPWHEPLSRLDQLARSLRSKRELAGATSIDRTEMAITVRDPARIEVRVLPRNAPGRQVVEELMVLCNSLLAEFCHREGLPAAYRSQAAPDLSDIPADVPPALRRHLVMRRLLPAELAAEPRAHGGLGVTAYLQATSPLRRYPDLVVQRQIGGFLRSGKATYTREEIASVSRRADVQIRELGRVEEERRRYWFLKFLAQQEADILEATVLETRRGRPALLELMDYPFRVSAELPETRVPGDVVMLRLHGVDLWRRTGRFVHVPEALEAAT